jgi:hypothetical protein
MHWPLSQDYNEAMQTPAASFSDSDLGRGQSRTGPLGLPVPCSGNFADVYQIGNADRAWAVKCFTREIPKLRERYAEISAYLQKVQLPFMVDFQYLDRGIRVRGQWYPVLKMDWVEGLTLNDFVKRNVDRPRVLEKLARLWVRMARYLRDANLAHCDLQHGNVLLVPGSRADSLAIKQVDYDGMFVPSLAGMPSGEVGHPAYQHPERMREATYSREVDRFPLLVIYCALRALMTGGRALWDRYDNGDNLLFRAEDLRNPRNSGLFSELRRLHDPGAERLVDALAQAAYQPLEETPLLELLIPDEDSRGLAMKPESGQWGGEAEFAEPLWASAPPPVRTSGLAPAAPVHQRQPTTAGPVTRLSAETGRMKGLDTQESRSGVAIGNPAGDASPLGNRVYGPPLSKGADHELAGLAPLPWWKRPGVIAVTAGASLALILASVVISASTKTSEGKIPNGPRPPEPSAIRLHPHSQPGDSYRPPDRVFEDMPGRTVGRLEGLEPPNDQRPPKPIDENREEKSAAAPNQSPELAGGSDSKKSAVIKTGKADEAKRKKRQVRWTMVFNIRNGGEYLRQLQALQASLALPVLGNDKQFQVFDLSKSPFSPVPKRRDEMKGIFWVDDKPQSASQLSRALGLANPAPYIVAFFPEKLEQQLLQLELDYGHVAEDDIEETRFVLKRASGTYEPVVVSQKTKDP